MSFSLNAASCLSEVSREWKLFKSNVSQTMFLSSSTAAQTHAINLVNTFPFTQDNDVADTTATLVP